VELKSSKFLHSEQAVSKVHERNTDTIGLVLAAVISIFFMAMSILYHHGGILHPEIRSYLPYYLSDRPLLNKLYDSKVLDQDMYQARELSYLFDYFDSKFIELSVSLGYPHFLSITTYIFFFAIALLIWHFSTRVVSLPYPIGIALVCIFWTTPSIFLGGNFFRSAKVGVALAAALLLIATYSYLHSEHQSSKRNFIFQWLIFFGLSWTMTLFDRQGVFIAGMALILLFFWLICFPGKYMVMPLSAITASLIMSQIYNVVLGPFLTQILNQYSPNFSYQHLPLQNFFDAPLIYIWSGISLYLDTVRFILGCFPALIIGTALTLLITQISFTAQRELRSTGRLSRLSATKAGIVFCNVFLLIALDVLMLIRHNLIVYPDIRRVYYWIPQTVIIILSIALFLSYITKENNRLKTVVTIVLILMVAGNLFALPYHNDIVLHGYIKTSNDYSPRLIEALEHLSTPHFQVPADVLQDPIFQWFKNSY
jgi:hypothetical protein